jgi:AcrR family transcriptional regulator
MSKTPAVGGRRADARRHAEAVLIAATRVLGRTPDAGIDQVAAAAGVSRQTVYAHFPGRDALLAAVIERISAEVLAELDAVETDTGPAADAVLGLLAVSWRLLERYPLLLHGAAASADPAEDRVRHEPIRDRFTRLLRRGREDGEFLQDVPLDWQVTAILALGHAAGAEVGSGRMDHDEALAVLHRTVLQLLAPPTGSGRADTDPG